MEWFEDWFNSPYYHLLYSHRNQEEAHHFMQNLLMKLQPPAGSRIMDLACGRGRHAQFLADKGFDVTGVDLSENNILDAQLNAHQKLHFFVHDMRFPFRINYFDYILNLFTSFGYFNTSRDELNTLKSAQKNLKPGGTLVIDFFNSHKIQQQFSAKEQTKVIQDIQFIWNKELRQNHVFKEITVHDKGHTHHYHEKVHLLGLSDFENYFKSAGLVLKETYGNYTLDAFDPESSDRLIMIVQKQ